MKTVSRKARGDRKENQENFDRRIIDQSAFLNRWFRPLHCGHPRCAAIWLDANFVAARFLKERLQKYETPDFIFAGFILLIRLRNRRGRAFSDSRQQIDGAR